MIQAVHIIGAMPSEDVMRRLIQAGLELQFYPAQFAEDAAEIVEGHPPLMLGIDPLPAPMRSWADIAGPEQADLGAGGRVPTPDQILTAVVQHNRCQLLTATEANTGAGSDATQQQQQQQQPLLVVGYTMKPSREDALAKAGMLHALPQEGICFMPVDLDTLTEQQQQQQQVHIDILLHKGSDELVPLPPSGGSTETAATGRSGAGGVDLELVGVTWSPRLVALQAWLAQQPSICVVDPFQHTAKVVDRYLLARLLQQLQGLQLPGGVAARGPAFCEASSFDGCLVEAVTATGLQPPFIVKPRVACGVPHSHSMALVLSAGALAQLQGRLPAPALVQEFVNHGGKQYKVYVMGEQVFVTPRASIPDIHLHNPAWQQQQQQQQQQQHQECVLFDSLASLPTQLPEALTCQQQQQGSSSPPGPPREDALKAMAAFLRQHLGLTLFGFDVVVVAAASRSGSSSDSSSASQQQQQQGQELVVIDVNYFPNYRGGSDVPAMFRAALRQAWEQHQQQLQDTS